MSLIVIIIKIRNNSKYITFNEILSQNESLMTSDKLMKRLSSKVDYHLTECLCSSFILNL